MPDETYIPSGVSFDGMHSYTDFGLWLMSRPSIGSPEAKVSIVDIPGADGNIDLTEANTGEVKYSNRTLTFEFGAMVDEEDQEAFRKSLMNYLHGKRIQKIILDEDPDWYWTGRASVEFSDVQSWRLRCTVTIDAAPYAMSVNTKEINLREQSAGDVQSQQISLAENTSRQSWNSEFLLGTKDFPTGIPTSGQPYLYIEWSQPPVVMETSQSYTLTIADSDGGVYTLQISKENVETSIDLQVPFSDIEQSVDLSKVYRILFSGVGGCSAYIVRDSVKYSIRNERKSILPEFELAYDSSIEILLNGVSVTIENGIRTYDNAVLRQGTNELFIPSMPAGVSRFLMRYREGKL